MVATFNSWGILLGSMRKILISVETEEEGFFKFFIVYCMLNVSSMREGKNPEKAIFCPVTVGEIDPIVQPV